MGVDGAPRLREAARRCGAVASPAPGSAILIPRERSTTPSATRMRALSLRRERLGPRTALFFSRVVAPLKGGNTARSTAPPSKPGGGVRVRADAQADMPLTEVSGAICVQRFDDSRTVQVTLRIAFRCVLHRCESQDIRC